MTSLSDLGEKKFIRQVLSNYAVTARPDAVEDCVTIDVGALLGEPDVPLVVYSLDHPPVIQRPLPGIPERRFFGRWVAACTCNDVLAMGARPRGFSLDLALPVDTDVAGITQFYDGILDVLTEYGAVMEGGNLDVNPRIDVVGLAWGTVSRQGVIRRRGARPGDYLAVTTELGIGWASHVLRATGRFDRLSPSARDELSEYNLLPVAPHRAIVDATTLLPGAITSGMDLSDGLAEFAYTIAGTGKLGVRVFEEWLPASPLLKECAAVLDVSTSALAVEFGFDMPAAHGYTVDPARWAEVEEIFTRHGSPIYLIGEVTVQTGVRWISATGASMPLPELWDDKCERGDAVRKWFDLVARCGD